MHAMLAASQKQAPAKSHVKANLSVDDLVYVQQEQQFASTSSMMCNIGTLLCSVSAEWFAAVQHC